MDEQMQEKERNGYKIMISNENTEEISIDTTIKASSEVTGLKFKMNTIDESAKKFQAAIRPEFIISGELNNQTYKTIKKFADWALDNDEETLYRDIEILVYMNNAKNAKLLRRYKFAHMYVVDYEEEDGKYSLFIVQNRTEAYSREVFDE